MEIRYLESGDVEQIKKIYDEYFSDLEIPDFLSFHCVFVVTDNDRIVSVGGLKPLVEAIVLTDRSFSVRKRRGALLSIFTALTYAAEKLGFKRIHAFTFEDAWANHLTKRMRFKVVKESNLLILELENG